MLNPLDLYEYWSSFWNSAKDIFDDLLNDHTNTICTKTQSVRTMSISTVAFRFFPVTQYSDLAPTGLQLRRGAADGQLARLFDLDLEYDFAALFPHLGHERLARHNGAGEPDLDVLEGAESGVMTTFVSNLSSVTSYSCI